MILKINSMRIIRPFNCLMASLAVFIGLLVSSSFFSLGFYWFDGFLALLSAFFITAAGNIINDYYDYEIDKLNNPDRPIPSGEVERKNAFYLSILFFFPSILLAYLINFYCFLLALFNSLLLFVYAKNLKSVPLVGNALVGYLVGSTFLFGGLVVGSLESILVLFVLATLATLGREIAKDIEDVEGDKGKVKTLPTTVGVKKSSYLTSFPTIFGILLSPLPFILNYFGIYYLLVVLIADMLFAYALYELITKKTQQGAYIYQKYSKFAMVLSLFSFIIGSIPL